MRGALRLDGFTLFLTIVICASVILSSLVADDYLRTNDMEGSELYGLFQARAAIRDADKVIVVEGYMDVVALAQYGIGYAVATLGTATSIFELATPEAAQFVRTTYAAARATVIGYVQQGVATGLFRIH